MCIVCGVCGVGSRGEGMGGGGGQGREEVFMYLFLNSLFANQAPESELAEGKNLRQLPNGKWLLSSLLWSMKYFLSFNDFM